MSENKINEFIKLFNDFKNIQQQQKMRGLNDFNIFTTVLKKQDEVRLHSRFLTFLLDPNANHCQGDLFLKELLQEIGLNSFFTDLNNCTAHCEYKNIDIYITDGDKHIIIENKIWAGDQKRQIKRYIKTINKENEGLDNENLVVVYLSVKREKPSNYSLFNSEKECENGFTVESESKNKILIGKGDCAGQEYQFINLNYNNQISKWLEKSHKQIANITNLSVGITQYQEVIAKLYGKYKEKVMDLEEYLKNKDNKKELVKTMQGISKEYQKYRVEVIHEFFKKPIELLKDKFKLNENWSFEIIKNGVTDKRYTRPLYIRYKNYKKSENIAIIFDFSEKNYKDSYFSIKRLDGEKLLEQTKNLPSNNNLKKGKNLYSLILCTYYESDIFDKIIDDGDKAVDNFVNAFMDIFDKYKDVVIECNKELDKPQ